MTPAEIHEQAERALHRLWTAAVGTPGYNKADWKLIAQQMHANCPSGCLVKK